MTEHKLHTLYTSHYRYAGLDRTDITVKGKHRWGRYFAPTWSMVLGVKNGTMSQDDYVRLYIDILQNVPIAALDWFFEPHERTLVCFCLQHEFCHRNIIVNYFVQLYGDRMKDGGWRTKKI